MSNTIDTLAEILKEIDETADPKDLNHELPIADQLDFDSMDFLEFVMLLKKNFQITIVQDDYYKLTTINEIVAFIEEKVNAK